jgi:hypothetical protein
VIPSAREADHPVLQDSLPYGHEVNTKTAKIRLEGYQKRMTERLRIGNDTLTTSKGLNPAKTKGGGTNPVPESAQTTKSAMTPEQIAAASMGKGVKERKTPPKPKKESPKKDTKTTKSKKPNTATPKERKKVGRPSGYTQELADAICAQLAEGRSMRTVCNDESMPCMTSVFKWLRENPEFAHQYARAKEESADAMAEEMMDIADDGTNDWMEVFDKEGDSIGYKLNGEHVQRSRLRIDTRKWLASKLKPKKYSDKVDLNHGLQPDNPIVSLLKQVSGTALPVVQDEIDE